MIGWTAGVGTDIKLTDNVFGRVEYRYTDFGSKSFDGRHWQGQGHRQRVTFGVGMSSKSFKPRHEKAGPRARLFLCPTTHAGDRSPGMQGLSSGNFSSKRAAHRVSRARPFPISGEAQ